MPIVKRHNPKINTRVRLLIQQGYSAQNIAITSAHMHESQILPLLVTGKEDQVFADKAYDSRKIFNLLDSSGTNAIIPLRKKFRTIARGSPLRHRTARLIRNMGEDEWKRIHNYGRRWIVEIYFSGLKRVMGEVIKARKLEYVIQEIGFEGTVLQLSEK